jgi:predicted nucleic-acid-binding protein
MIGTDTNILLRYFLRDDPAQFGEVDALFERAESVREPVFVATVVLCETLWSLRTKGKWRRAALADAIEKLLETEMFLVENEDLVTVALQQFRQGKADFPDYMIGQLNQAKGCRHTVTFDRDLHSEPGFVPSSKR